MYQFIKLEKESEALEDFILNHPRSSIFQSFRFHQTHSEVKNILPFTYAAQNEKGQILGILSGVIHSHYSWPLNLFTTRSVIIGGPIVQNDDHEILRFLLKNYDQKIRRKCIYSQFRNTWHQEGVINAFEQCGYQYEKHLDIIIDLNPGMEEILNNISKNKRRNVIKSSNKGCSFREIENREEYLESLDLVYQTYSRINLPIADRTLFIRAFDILRPLKQLLCFGVFIQGRCIGIRLELIYKGTIYDWYAGSDYTYKSLYPNDFLIYHIIKWGKEKNFKEIRLGGAGKPGIPYGVRDHKMKFGGQLVEFGRYEKIHKKLRYFIGSSGHRILHRK